MKKMTLRLILVLLIASFVFSACQESAPVVDTNATETANAVIIALATEMKATADAVPTSTMTPEPTAPPTSTPRPTDIPPTPTLEMPVSPQTPVPFEDTVIDRSNAKDVELLALYGMGTIEEISVSPSGSYVAAATISGVSLYQTGSPEYAQHYLTNQSVRAIDFSPNGEMVAAGLQTGELVVISIGNGQVILREAISDAAILSVAYSPDGNYIAVGDLEGMVAIYSAADLTLSAETSGHSGRINDLAWSPDSQTLASGSSDFYTRLWNLDGQEIDFYLFQNGSITSVAFSNDGTRLATGSSDFTVFIRNLEDEEALPIVLENDNIVRTIAFSPDDKQIAIGGDDYGVDTWILFADDGTYLGFLSQTLNHDYTVISTEYLPDGETLVTATWGSLLSWWNVTNRETTQTVDRGFLISAGIFAREPYILSEPAIGNIDVYNAESLQNLISIEEAHNTTIYQALLSPDLSWLVTASYDGYRVWDMETSEMAYEGLGYPGFISALKWSDGSELLGVGFNNGDVVIFDAVTRSEEIYDISNERILAIDFSNDLNIVASAGDDNNVNLWRRTDGRTVVTLEGHIDTIYDVAFSPDGNTIASASSDYTVNIWQGITGEPEEYGQFITSLDEHTFRVKGVAFSPDGSLIATTADDGTAILWNAENGESLLTLEGFTGYAKRIAFNEDGTLLYTYDWDGVMRIFGLLVE
jgi:WD40 repeat protein